MTKEILLKEITSNPEIKSYCKKICNGFHDDLMQDIAIIIMEYPESKTENIKCSQCFIIGIITNMVFSKTSPFYYKYRKNQYSEIKNEVGESEDLYIVNNYMECIEKNLPSLYWFDKKIISEWMKSQDMKKVSSKYKISHSFVFRTVTRIKKHFREICR